MSVVIFGDNFSFPEGDASTNRVHTFAKGLTENGKPVNVICFANEYNSAGDDQINAIRYFHPFGQRKRNKYFLVRRWEKFIKYFRTIKLFRKLNKEEHIEVIIIYTMRLTTHMFAWFLSAILRSSLVKECSEHPMLRFHNGKFKSLAGKIKLRMESKFTDGIFCISRYLIEFFNANGVPENKLFLLPSTVDPTRFDVIGGSPVDFKYVGYFGGLTFDRDNVDVLVKAFKPVSKNHVDIKLILGGFCTAAERKQLEDLIAELELNSQVVLLKYLPRELITRYIGHSYILVMVRSMLLETQASFPSKLTEFLATSKPVITVSTGEIPDYIYDGQNAYVVEAGNTLQISGKLEYIIENYDEALEVGKKGKQLADTVFNYNYQAKRMISFFETLQ